jgi:hypothetical protein
MFILESKMVWARTGKTITRKFRCSLGPRKGRVVSTASQCMAPMDLKKRQVMKKTRAQKGIRMTRKAKKIKKYSPQSRMLRRLNQ